MAALSRATLTTALANRSGRALVGVGLLATDTAGNMKEPLDDTFLALGTAYSGLATATYDDSALPKFLAVGAVYVLRRALEEAVGFADVSATELGASKKKSQIVANLETQLARAESAAVPYGVTGLNPVMGSGVYSIDIIEPEDVA